MRKHVFTVFSVLVIVAMLLSACGGGATPTAAPKATEAPKATAAPNATEAPKPAAGGFKIGLVTDVGRVNDRSFNQSAWDGAQQAAKELGVADADVKYVETQDSKDYADNIQQFVDNGYNVIITVGFALGDATTTAAKANPGINFVGVDQFQGATLPNLTGLIFHEDQSGYLAGALAASLTKTGTIAAVLGTDLIPPVVAFKEGYEAGAKAIKPDIKILSTYHPGEISQAFVDPEWGAATAKQAIDQGADVVFGAGGQTGNGALQEVATHAGLYCIGVDTDQWETVPAAQPCLVSSAMKLITPGVVDLVKMAKDAKFPGGNYFGGSGLAAFHDFDAKLPKDLKDKLTQLKADLDSGKVKTGYPKTASTEPFKIGLVTDVGRVNDRSFNQSAWDGAQQVAKELGVADDDVKYVETQDSKDYADNIQQFVDNGYNVIITVGFALGDATTAAATANPKINFIGVDQFQGATLPNLTGLIFHEDQSGYLAGALAASLTKSGTIAGVFGTDLIPPVVAFKEGYEAGAKATKPDIKIISTYHPGEISQAFVDPEWGAATAKQAIDQGADVVFGAGGQTGNGALQEVATHAGLYCIGVDTDQWETVPAAHPCLVSSAMKLITPGVVDLVKTAKDAKFPGGNYFGGSGLAAFHDFDAKLPKDLKDKLTQLKADLDSGKIKTGYPKTAAPTTDIGTEANPIKVYFVPSVDANVIVTGGDIMAAALEKATGLKFKV
ncbi:MAG: BMP family ABC transporter substrate-binding protein, partial [Anaerolineae bacterium]